MKTSLFRRFIATAILLLTLMALPALVGAQGTPNAGPGPKASPGITQTARPHKCAHACQVKRHIRRVRKHIRTERRHIRMQKKHIRAMKRQVKREQ
jgi:hypothetical protein